MFKLTLVAAVVAAGIALPASAHSVVKRHHVAVHHSRMILYMYAPSRATPFLAPTPGPLVDPSANPDAALCEQAREVDWPSTHCAVY
ncbi:MAG TPA: hypothetical protein VGJ20_23215 [Xanthobacteraceae bacterium]|jgi:hypothetical protein